MPPIKNSSPINQTAHWIQRADQAQIKTSEEKTVAIGAATEVVGIAKQVRVGFPCDKDEPNEAFEAIPGGLASYFHLIFKLISFVFN